MSERISGITFLPCRNPRFATSHAERTDLCGPKYLLPASMQLANKVIYGDGKEDAIAKRYIKRCANLSRQARAAKATPFIEGVCVLPAFDHTEDYSERMAERCMRFKERFEQETGCTVLHVSLHLDEGYVDDFGVPHLNTHAHFLVDKTLENGKLWKPGHMGLAKVQTFLAECLEMKRGTTIYDRDGKPARKHISHEIYRQIKESERALLREQQRVHEREIAIKDFLKQEDARSVDSFLVKMNDQHSAQLKGLEAEHAKVLADQEAKHKQELDLARQSAYDEANAYVKTLNALHAQALGDQEAKHKQELDAARKIIYDEANAYVRTLKDQHAKALGDQEAKHKQELNAARKITYDDANAEERGRAKGKVQGAAYGAVRKALIDWNKTFAAGEKPVGQADYSALRLLQDDAQMLQWAELNEAGKLRPEDLLRLVRGEPLAEVLRDCEIATEAESADFEGVLEGSGPAPHLAAGGVIAHLERWQREDRDLYLVPGAAPGQRLAFTDEGDCVNVRLSDDDEVLLAALVLAQKKWPKGITITGSEDFVRRAEAMASDYNITVLPPPSHGVEPR